MFFDFDSKQSKQTCGLEYGFVEHVSCLLCLFEVVLAATVHPNDSRDLCFSEVFGGPEMANLGAFTIDVNHKWGRGVYSDLTEKQIFSE